jgi:uncharacterized membrane protein YsdA (DUF1294 family)/cold shock CspA family protein
MAGTDTTAMTRVSSSVRTKGRISSWNDDKGYGFIAPLAGGDRAFIHIKAFANRSRRPSAGDLVTYFLARDARGRPCAERAVIAGVPAPVKTRRSAGVPSLLLASGFLLLVAGAAMASAVPMAILIAYLLASLATFAVYALDKRAAEKGHWRTPESTLHLMSLAGGWPGALFAQSQLRHKTRKQPFRAVFWLTVLLNGATFGWLFTELGATALQSLVAAIA